MRAVANSAPHAAFPSAVRATLVLSLHTLGTLAACGKTEPPPPPPPASAPSTSATALRGCALPKELPPGGAFVVARGCAVDVPETYAIERGAKLTIEPGATLRFHPGAALELRSGALVAEGTTDAPITFTSGAAKAVSGGWIGLEVVARSTSELRLARVIVEGAGEKTSRGSAGLRFLEPPGGVDAGAIPTTIVDSKFRQNGATGIQNDVHGNRFVKLEGNSFDDHWPCSMTLYADLVGSIGANELRMPLCVSGVVWTSAKWPKLNVKVDKLLGVGAQAGKETTLTLAEGSLLSFEDGELQVGLGDGRARFVATDVRFTSTAPLIEAVKRRETYWRGIHVYERGGVALDRCQIDSVERDAPADLVIDGKAVAGSSLLAPCFSDRAHAGVLVQGAPCGPLADRETRCVGKPPFCVSR
jgi:hypothetical protein